MDTVPGYTLTSSNFSIKFICAEQKKKVSYLLEYETDWKEVMQILLACLETCPTNTTRSGNLATEKLEAWALLQEGGLELQLKIRTQFQESLYYRQSDSCKNAILIFNDMFDTVITFEVRKKKRLQSLRTCSARAVSSMLHHLEDVRKLEIPRTLTLDLRAAFMDSWRSRNIYDSPKTKKLSRMSLTNMKVHTDCPYCKRTGFKKLQQHIKRSKSCSMKHKLQMGFEESAHKLGATLAPEVLFK